MTQPVGTGLRVVFWMVAVLTGLTGLTMFLFPGPAGGQYWPWPLTPLVSRYLGALFIGVAVGAIVCARAKDWTQVKPLFPPGLTFTGLSIVATTIHFASFNPERWATWLFFGLYGAVFVAGLAAYVQYERAGRAAAGRRAAGSADPPEQTAIV
jgi:peptidoglycan/LPS O-acetylase OafA/YrhL